MLLTREKCVAYRRDSPKVTAEDIAELSPYIPVWKFARHDGINRLRRRFGFRNFAGAMSFAYKVAEAAEREGYHPRINLEWGSVGV